jgi:hypothetical protein
MSDKEEWSAERRQFYRLSKKDFKRRPTCCSTTHDDHRISYFAVTRLPNIAHLNGYYLDEMAKPVSEKLIYCPFCGRILYSATNDMK